MNSPPKILGGDAVMVFVCLIMYLNCLAPNTASAFCFTKNSFTPPALHTSCTHDRISWQRWQRRPSLLQLFPDDAEKTISTVTPPSALSSNKELSSAQAVITNPELCGTELDCEDVYKGAIIQTIAWVAAATAFGAGVWAVFGQESGEEFFAGYLVEQSLSVDNLFVFLLLFEYFKVPLAYQNRVLNWGIFGAMVMRAGMIGLGALALKDFHGVLLVFAGILIYSSIQVLAGDDDDDEEDMGENAIVKFSKSFMESTDEYDGDNFFTMKNGVKVATPLFICMFAVEVSDVVFAVDSIPAVFGVTENPLIVYSSNIFAIMGLRSLYTILSKAAQDLKYLEPSVAIVLAFIGSKMIAEFFGTCISTNVSLAIVVTLLSAGIGLSILEKDNDIDDQ